MANILTGVEKPPSFFLEIIVAPQMHVKNLAWPLPAGVILIVGAWLLSLDQRSA